MKENNFFRAAIVLFVLSMVGYVWAYQSLPLRYPSHFNFDGVPDGWTDKNLFSWFIIPAISLALLSFMYFITPLFRKYPQFINIPGKEKFLELSDERKEPVFKLAENLMGMIAIVEQLLFLYIQYAMWSAALSPGNMMPPHSTLIIIGHSVFVLGIVIFYLVKISDKID